MNRVSVFDCNVYIGLPLHRQIRPIWSTDELLTCMRKDGVARALVWHVAQYEYSASAGNDMLAREIDGREELVSCWAILPDAASESLAPLELPERMKASRIGALRSFPSAHGFRLDEAHCGGILRAMAERRIPLFLSMRKGSDYATAQSVLEAYPDLVCVLCDHSEWAIDREVVTLLDRYSNLHVDTTFCGMHGMIETLCERFGAHRILFGSGFPETSFAAMVREIEQAGLCETDRAAVAGGNLTRLLEGAML